MSMWRREGFSRDLRSLIHGGHLQTSKLFYLAVLMTLTMLALDVNGYYRDAKDGIHVGGLQKSDVLQPVIREALDIG